MVSPHRVTLFHVRQAQGAVSPWQTRVLNMTSHGDCFLWRTFSFLHHHLSSAFGIPDPQGLALSWLSTGSPPLWSDLSSEHLLITVHQAPESAKALSGASDRILTPTRLKRVRVHWSHGASSTFKHGWIQGHQVSNSLHLFWTQFSSILALPRGRLFLCGTKTVSSHRSYPLI